MSNEKSPQAPKPIANVPAPMGVDKIITDALKDILNPAQQRQAVDRLKPKIESWAVTISKFHSGPLPSVETVNGYEAVVPGSFQRILAMAERDQLAVIESQSFKSRSDSRFRIFSLVAGLFALLAILGVIVYLAPAGLENTAIAVAGLGAAGIVGVFVNARYSKP